ncbi:MAG: M20 family metallopeptidase [Bacillota bacterium]|nr:M20 family metallopeptidase [Bacillota bacterium]
MQFEEEIIALRREFHTCPEIGMENPATAELIIRYLRNIGINDIKAGLGGGTGISAIIHGAEEGMCLALRADTDGLPVFEETGLPFASVNGNAHACGHDGHMAMLLGAARLLMENRHNLCGSIKLIFQPGEEYGIGAKKMVAAGVLEDPHVDAVAGQHTGSLFDGIASGEIGYFEDYFGFCVTRIDAVFHGRGGHTSRQHEAVDAILIACNAVTQLQAVMSRERKCDSPAVISIGTINGGVKNNIIADTCTVTGTIRSKEPEEQRYYEERTEKIFRSVAESFRGTSDVAFPYRLKSTPIDPKMLAIFKGSAAKVMGAEKIKQVTAVTAVGEDFSEYCLDRPGLFWFHCSAPDFGSIYPHHHPKFDIAEKHLGDGARLLAQFAVDWLQNCGGAK